MCADSGHADGSAGGYTRALVVGALCAAFISVAFPYANLVIRGSRPANTSLPFGWVAVLFAVVVANSLVRALSARLALLRDDLLHVGFMGLLAAAVPTWGLIGQLLPIMAGAHYYATPENRWEDLILPHVPAWMAPQSPAVSRHFYEGLPPGARIPWADWALPLGGWLILVVGYYAASMGVMLLFRKQWLDRERLIFPLMRLPLEITDGEQGRLPGILRSPALWVGVALVLVPTALNGLHAYLPVVPSIKLRFDFPIPLQRETMLLRLWHNFMVMGFSYTVSADLGFTLWFFALIAAVQTPLMRLAGVSLGGQEVYCAGSPAVSNQAMGAMVFLVVAGVWTAQGTLREQWRTALAGPPGSAGPPRAALALTIGGLALMAAWLVASGVPWLATGVFLFAAFCNFIALTRATVQGGIPVTRAALIPQSFTAYMLGSRAIGDKGIVSLGYAFAWTADIRVVLMTYYAHGLRLWAGMSRPRQGILTASALALAISLVGGTAITLYFAYTRGGVSLSSWLFSGNPMSAFRYAASQIETPVEPGLWRIAYLLIGGGAMWALTGLHQRFLWWPLHPLGFAVAATQPIQDLWWSILIGWALKALTIRYGGYRAYQALLPLMLGLVLGQALGCAGWLIADGILGKTGNLIFVY